jgi:uncharacterized cupredoxin-like copper-binding protein
MVIRAWIIAGAVFIVVAWLLTVPLSPRPYQGRASSHLDLYRAQGLVPKGALTLSPTIGHEIFEVPAEDAARAQMTDMSARSSGDHAGMRGMSMRGDEAHGPTPGMITPEHDPAGHGAMPGMDMAHEPAGGHPQMPGTAAGEAGHGGHGAGGGLRIMMAHGPGMAQAREIRLQMREWGFEPSRIRVEPGEVVRLVVDNDGQSPHEFMLMSHAAMAAVNYRLERADWNLLEHEAIYEREIVMPGDSIEITLQIDQPGAWMFMCMFPYHMQFGMMGSMATEGMGTSMEGMHM